MANAYVYKVVEVSSVAYFSFPLPCIRHLECDYSNSTHHCQTECLMGGLCSSTAVKCLPFHSPTPPTNLSSPLSSPQPSPSLQPSETTPQPSPSLQPLETTPQPSPSNKLGIIVPVVGSLSCLLLFAAIGWIIYYVRRKRSALPYSPLALANRDQEASYELQTELPPLAAEPPSNSSEFGYGQLRFSKLRYPPPTVLQGGMKYDEREHSIVDSDGELNEPPEKSDDEHELDMNGTWNNSDQSFSDL